MATHAPTHSDPSGHAHHVDPRPLSYWWKRAVIWTTAGFMLGMTVVFLGRTLFGNNQAVYSLLRYGVPVKIEAGKVTETVQIINWQEPEQRVMMRRGAIGQVRRGRLAFVAEVRSLGRS